MNESVSKRMNIAINQVCNLKTMDFKIMSVVKLLLLSLFVLSLSGCGGKTATVEETEKEEVIRPARIADVSSFESSGIRTFPAIIDANKKSDLAFRVSGQLTKVYVQAGSQVKKGQVLARVDSTDYKNTLADRQAKLQLAKTQHKQTVTLFRKKYASQAEVDTVNAQLRAAQVAVKQAQQNVAYTKIVAPFSGAIAHVSVENFQFIQPQQTIVQLQNTSQLDVKFDVPESVIKGLKQGDEYRKLCGVIPSATAGGENKMYKACYKEHDSVPDSQTRTYPVLFSLENPKDTNLIPGMSTDIIIDMSKLMDTSGMVGVIVPVEAIFDSQDQQWVWKLDEDMRTVKTKVKVGGIQDNQMQITDGLSQGDKVVTAGVSYLVEGQKVRPFLKERGL